VAAVTPLDAEEDVATLVAAERLEEAAEVCLRRERWGEAAALFARASQYGRAAEAARRGGDAPTAMLHASRALTVSSPGEEAASATSLSNRFPALQATAAALDPPAARAVAETLVARGLSLGAAFAFARAGDHAAAARNFERGGQLLLAAQGFVRAGDTAEAARVATTLRTQDPHGADASAAGLLLGTLLAEAGRWPQAARVLQSITEGAAEAAEAKHLLASVLERMGLSEARRSLGDLPTAGSAPGALAGASFVPPSSADATSPVLFGRYVVLRTVATSPSARVLEALDRLTNEPVAVKLLLPAATPRGRDAIVRFEREATALKTLRHAHVVPLLRFHPEGPAAVFPWQKGGSLADVLGRGPMAPERAATIATSLLDALAAAHSAGILHRDVKPSNVLFDAASSASLSDFGAAHLGEGDTTVTAGLIGSLSYMAPEQLAAEPASAASDVYAVGAVLYECITGASPRPADDLTWWPSAAYPGELGAAHDAIVGRLLARERAARPSTAQEAASLVRSVRWTTRGPAPRRAQEPREAPAVPDARLRRLPGSAVALFDERLRRQVSLAPAASLPLARALALLDSPAFEVVLRVEPLTEQIWIEHAAGPSLAEAPRSPQLTVAEATRLREALNALHAAGATHGSVDEDHVLRSPEGVVWRFPLSVSGQSIDEERALADRRLRAWSLPHLRITSNTANSSPPETEVDGRRQTSPEAAAPAARRTSRGGRASARRGEAPRGGRAPRRSARRGRGGAAASGANGDPRRRTRRARGGIAPSGRSVERRTLGGGRADRRRSGRSERERGEGAATRERGERRRTTPRDGAGAGERRRGRAAAAAGRSDAACEARGCRRRSRRRSEPRATSARGPWGRMTATGPASVPASSRDAAARERSRRREVEPRPICTKPIGCAPSSP
jgi:eukaryotic-like serine/threonine-protein kinase